MAVLCILYLVEYSRLLLFVVITFCKVTVNTEQLPLGDV